MKGIILSYRRGRHSQNVNQMLVEVEGIDKKEKAEKMIGKKLVWKSTGNKEIMGEFIGVHGGKGILRAKFERNLPGQAITTKVEILE